MLACFFPCTAVWLDLCPEVQDLESGKKLFELEHEVLVLMFGPHMPCKSTQCKDSVSVGRRTHAMLPGALDRAQKLPFENIDTSSWPEQKKTSVRFPFGISGCEEREEHLSTVHVPQFPRWPGRIFDWFHHPAPAMLLDFVFSAAWVELAQPDLALELAINSVVRTRLSHFGSLTRGLGCCL